MSRLVWLLASALLMAWLLLGCGGNSGSNSVVTAPGDSAATAVDAPPRNLSVEQAVAEVADAVAPAGIDAELYERLKGQLIRDIRATSADKVTAKPPEGDYNQVTDLKLLGNPTDGMSLQWTYLNRGDCNLDGLVSINDLTPIGLHFNRSQDEGDWATASRADGNGDGLVTINDITPIGQNYLNYCVGYNIYGAAGEDGPWNMLGSLELPDAPTTGKLVITFSLPATPDTFFQIRPYDDLGNEGIASQVALPTVDPQPVQLGSDTFDFTELIGPLGGTIGGQLGTGGPTVEFEFPLGAITELHSFRLGTNDGSYQPELGEFKSPIVAIDTDGVRSFARAVKIRVSFAREDFGSAIVPFIVDDDGRLHMIDAMELNENNFVAEFETYQLHKHLVWVIQEVDFGDIFGPLRTVAFDPALDGLQVVNTGSMWHPGGECFGMTAFSNWYYITQVWSEGDLFPRFMYEVPIYGGLSGQRIISTRSFTSIAKEWQTYWDTFVGPQGGLNDAQRFASVCNGIENAGHPVLVDLRHENGAGGAHSVLAYAYSASELFVYDPNAPGIERIITFNSDTGSFSPYSGYDSIRYSGSGALWLDEPYQYILDDAEHQFAENGYASITITSHADGEDVPAGMRTLTGTVESTVELVDELQISVGTWEYLDINLPASGNFSVPVLIQSGDNPFYFSTWATRLDGSEVFVPHDMPSGAFSLNGV